MNSDLDTRKKYRVRQVRHLDFMHCRQFESFAEYSFEY